MELYSEYPKHLVAVDCIIFGYDIIEKEIKLLLVKRSFSPAKGEWSLAGGFVEKKESLDVAACRILCNLTGLKNVYLKQLHCYGDNERDPGARVISVAYWALIKLKDIDTDLAGSNGARWQSMKKLPQLIFDHDSMVAKALVELKLQIKIKPLGFELLPEKFTLVQMLDLYEAIYQRRIDKRNFRKKILSMDILEKLDEKEKQTSKKGAYYYRFIVGRYNKLVENGYYFNLDVN
ncbi:MAG: NUDIX hydrolase [Bacteroidales bacterium]|nr:NUDIX hydrolase [Bacteroidales bacterium]MBN2632627.1 NUDIX hydrolase [Bacteroidales bacterium]